MFAVHKHGFWHSIMFNVFSKCFCIKINVEFLHSIEFNNFSETLKIKRPLFVLTFAVRISGICFYFVFINRAGENQSTGQLFGCLSFMQ